MEPDPIGSILILELVFILISAFFAASESAVLSLSENILKQKAEEGDKKAKMLLYLRSTTVGFFSTTQSIVTFSAILASAFATLHFSPALTNWLVKDLSFTAISESTLTPMLIVLMSFVLAFVMFLFGNILPKRIATHKGESMARALVTPVYFIHKFFSPLIFLVTKITDGLLRLFRIDPHSETNKVTEEEIRLMVDLGEEKGTIEQEERTMIENVFEFNNMTAEECMTHRTDITPLPIDATQEEMLHVIQVSGLSRFPVYGEDMDDIIGTVTTRDILLNLQLTAPKPLEKLVRPAYFVPESISADILFRQMQSKKTHLAIVVDEYGGTSGLITLEDLLEEIVGEIQDEFDPQEEQEIQKIGDNVYRVAGVTQMEELAEYLDIPFEEDTEYDTLGGLIFNHLNAIPKDGTTPSLTVGTLHIDVELVAERRIVWAKVTVLPRETEDTDEII